MKNVPLIWRVILFLLIVRAGSHTTLYAQPSQVKGHIKGLANRPVLFIYRQNGTYKTDTVLATNDYFSYTPKTSDDGRIMLGISRPRYTSFWYEPGLVNIAGSVDKPYRLTFKGEAENALLDQYQQSIDWAYEDRLQTASDSSKTSLLEQKRRATLAFIQQHPASRTSAYLLYWETMLNEQFMDTYQTLYSTLTPSVKASYQGKEVAKRIDVLRNQPVIGKLAPDFTLPDTTGRPISLSSYRGKYVLLDFWGHWCSPCLKSFPKLKSMQGQYADKLVILGVAAEYATDKSVWLRAINTHQLNWPQVSELMADKGHVNEAYNITAFPTYLLLDPQGVVLERSLGLDAIEKKLTELSR